MVDKKEVLKEVPEWFYYASILSAFLFTMYMSIYSAIHFESIRYMNIVVVFFIIAIVAFFLISMVYFHAEKKGYHTLASILFLVGMVSLIFYAYEAVDASNIVRFSIIYTIVVMGVSLFILLSEKKLASSKFQN